MDGQGVLLEESLDEWYADLEAWHAEVFKDAVEVYGGSFASNGWTFCSDEEYQKTTHTALLINIQPIKEESAEDILEQLVRNGITEEGFQKAKAWLEKNKKSTD